MVLKVLFSRHLNTHTMLLLPFRKKLQIANSRVLHDMPTPRHRKRKNGRCFAPTVFELFEGLKRPSQISNRNQELHRIRQRHSHQQHQLRLRIRSRCQTDGNRRGIADLAAS